MSNLDERLKKAKKIYIEMFDDYFPNISINKERELEIAEKCIKAKKDAYEMGYFNLDSDYLY